MTKIKDIKARQIFDSRGNPTVEVDVITNDNIIGRAAVPSGASTGEHEAVELRDGGNDYMGKGVSMAVNNVNSTIRENLLGKSVFEQKELDSLMIDLDGTENKCILGANAILGVSLAISQAGAKSKNLPLYQYIGGNSAITLPVPMMNIINGGSHSDAPIAFQEFMIVPVNAESFSHAMKIGTEIFHNLKSILSERGLSTSVGDEGGFAPKLKGTEDALETIIKSISSAGFKPGDDLVEIIKNALIVSDERLQDDDIVVIAQKIISKAEGRIVSLNSVKPSPQAEALATKLEKDPRQIELVLQESKEIVRSKPGVVIVEQNLGLVMANAGIDRSNVVDQDNDHDEYVLLLPKDPDASCDLIRHGINQRLGVKVGIIVNDSVGRAWRIGTTGHAIGISGLPAVIDLRGELDMFGKELLVSEQAVADELASAASLLQGQASEGMPVVVIRGFKSDAEKQKATALIRDREMDMFR